MFLKSFPNLLSILNFIIYIFINNDYKILKNYLDFISYYLYCLTVTYILN